MAARTKSKVTPKYKTKYRVRSWAGYEESLRRRGNITVWFDADAVRSWNAPPSGRSGGQKEYSDVAIETALTLRSLFHLGLRQTEGFVGSLIRLMGLELRVPDHTTLSRRGRTIDVRSLPRKGDGPLHLVIDSTGLKVVGGVGRRRWRKESGANQHARAENGMVRFKQILGARLRSRSEDGPRREAMIGVNILNRITELGMPESAAVRA